MSREAFVEQLRQDLPGLPGPVRAGIDSDANSDLGRGPIPGRSDAEVGLKRCLFEFAGAVQAILQESSHDA